MTNPINVTLNNIPCISAHCTMRTGARPSTAHCIVPTNAIEGLSAAQPATLTFSDDATTATVRSMTIRSVNKRPDGTSRVRLADRRADWQARTTIDLPNPTASIVIRGMLTVLGERASLADLARADQAIGTLILNDAPAADALATVLARIGQSYTIDFDGALRAVSTDAPRLDSPLLMSHSTEPSRRPASLRIMSGPGRAPASVAFTGVPVCRDETGAWRDLAELVAEWGVDAEDLTRAVLTPGGLSRLLAATSATGPEQATRAALLSTHAYRSYRIPNEQQHLLPLLAVRGTDGAAPLPPLVEHTGFVHRPDLTTEAPLADPFAASTDLAPHVGGFSLDARNGIVTFDRVVAHLAPLTPPVHHATLEGREVAAPPTIRITASRATNAGRVLGTHAIAPSNTLDASTNPTTLTLGHLAPSDGAAPSDDSSLAEASATAARIRRALPSSTLAATLAGAHAITPHAASATTIHADASTGLTTTIRPDANATSRILAAFATPSRVIPTDYHAPSTSSPEFPSAITALRTGPLIISASDDIPNAALAFARATSIDEATGALTLDQLAPLATPFHLANTDADAPGRWCIAVPVRKTATGELLLNHLTETNDDHAAVATTPLGRSRPIPEGTDGILMLGADGETKLVLYDRPIVAEARSASPGAYSTEIRELVGTALDEVRRGPLHLVMVMALSPTHAAAGIGGTSGQRGWVPVLNLRDYNSGTDVSAMLAGRGLFADGSGTTLGRLAHSPNQAGPIFSDANTCDKHHIGEVTHGEETFRECAGHISTGAFFKVPGDATFDAPIAFLAATSHAAPGDGYEYLAEIKLHSDEFHYFNGEMREGRWVVTYKMPIIDPPPPPGETWPPREDPPVVVPKNIVAPSFDWSPPGGDPSSGPGAPEEGEEDVPYLGAVVSSVGYAPLATEGHPDPALGGGVYFMPHGMRLMDGAPWDYSGPRYWVTLHPSLGLAFGKPNYGDAECAPSQGYRACINESGELEVSGVDGSGDPDPTMLMRVTGAFATQGTTALASGESALLGFFGQEPAARPIVEGSHGDLPALVSLIDALATLGLITNETTS